MKGQPKPHPRAILDAYYAGIIDGEGCVALEKHRKAFKPTIKVKMTHHETLLGLQAEYGGQVNRHRNDSGSAKGHKPQWSWAVKSNVARAMAERLLPYLIIKREAAERLLAYRGIRAMRRGE